MSYTDWVPALVESKLPLKKLTCVEFGLGMGTTYLVDSFYAVISIEINDKKQWYEDTWELLSNRRNWSSVYLDCTKYGFKRTECSKNKILQNLMANVDAEVPDWDKVDVALVDPAILQRWEIAQWLFDQHKVQTIIVHDFKDMVSYGYQYLNPVGYTFYDFPTGCGTRVYTKV